MKPKQKIDTIIATISIIMGGIILILPALKITSLKWISLATFSIYALISLIQFILTKSSKDYEGLHSFLSSLVIVIAHFIWDPSSNPKVLALFLIAWIMLMSLTKLKKADFYHDRRDRMWKYSTLNLSLFILVGLLSSISLAYGTETEIIVLGFFMLTNGILELLEPVAKDLIAHS